MDKVDQHRDALIEAQIALLKGIKHYADSAVQKTGGSSPDGTAGVAEKLAEAYNLITYRRGSAT